MSESRVIVLTGCASGLGRQLATDLYRAGHRIVATDVNEGPMADWQKKNWPDGERVEVQRLDVREADAWERLLDRVEERFGHIDVLCNVAGYLAARWSHEMTLAEVGLTVDVNVKGVIFGTNAAARRMLKRGSGHVVNVASIAGLTPVPGLAVYSATKHAIRAFSLAVSQELKPHGIYVTVVCPGPIATPMLDVQLPRDEAALTFSAPRALSAAEVSKAIIDRALELRPLELIVPVPGSGQATLAKLVGAMPELATWVRPMLTRMGKRHQARLRSHIKKSD
jgi:3-oxoacyl-[acyl-carrier protein] reductase